jgi:hypothetical protein
MNDHRERPVKPKPLSITQREAFEIASRLVNVPADRMRDMIIITVQRCGDCELPHSIALSSTAATPNDNIAILTMAISDLLLYYEGE